MASMATHTVAHRTTSVSVGNMSQSPAQPLHVNTQKRICRYDLLYTDKWKIPMKGAQGYKSYGRGVDISVGVEIDLRTLWQKIKDWWYGKWRLTWISMFTLDPWTTYTLCWDYIEHAHFKVPKLKMYLKCSPNYNPVAPLVATLWSARTTMCAREHFEMLTRFQNPVTKTKHKDKSCNSADKNMVGNLICPWDS